MRLSHALSLSLTCNCVALFLVLVTGINKDRFDAICKFPSLPSTTTTTTQNLTPASMPTRPKKSIAELVSPVPCFDHVLLSTHSDNQHPPPSPPPAPPIAELNPLPRRVNASQRPISLVVRNTRKSRNKSFHASIPRSNHYILARSLVENDRPPKPLTPEQRPREHHKAVPSQLYRDTPHSDFIIPDFIWRFSASYLDSKTRDAFAALKSCDPETFKELVAGPDEASVDDIHYMTDDEVA